MLLISCFLLVSHSTRLHASHAAGGELLYEWVSGSTYRFYFKFYRDCSGIPEPDSQRMCYFNSCNNQSGQVWLQKMIVLPGGILNAEEVSPGCAGFYTLCSGGSLTGFREWWYSATVTLPSQCNYWTFYISLNGRNPSDNIPSSSMTGVPLYLEATLNNLDAQGSSSPYFTVRPVPYVCVNSTNTYNSGVVDPDNDSLGFELIHPRTMSLVNATLCQGVYSATDLPFLGTFSLAEPFATNGTFTFDPVTGQMTFTPSSISINTLTIRVNKYRRGIRVGSVLRDIQMKVVSCSTNQPSFSVIASSVNGAQWTGGRMEGTTNTTINFCYYSASRPGTILSVSDNHVQSLPGSVTTYTRQLGDSVVGCLSWTPSCADTGLKLFAVTVKDSTCLSPGILVAQTFVVPIYIRSAATPTNRNIVICQGGAVSLRPGAGTSPVSWSVAPGGSPLSSLSCTACRNPSARPAVTTTYIASYYLGGGCRQEDRITVTVDTGSILITPSDPHVMCRPDSLQLDADVSSYPYRENLSCGITAGTPGRGQDSGEILLIGDPLQRVPNNASTPFTGSYPTVRHQYLVRAEDIKAAGITSGSLKSISFHISAFKPGASFSNLNISLACTELSTLDPAQGFVAGTIPVYTATAPVTISSSGTFTDIYFDHPYNWDTTKNLVVDICYTNSAVVPSAYTYYFNTGYTSTLYAYAPSGNICGAASPAVSSAPELPHMRFGYDPAPALPYSYTWQNSGFTPSGSVKNPATYIEAGKQIYVYTSDRFGCRLGDTLEVIIPEKPSLPGDTGICRGDAIRLPVSHGTNFQWYENGFNPPATLSCTDCASPVAMPEEDISYTVVVIDSFGCTDTLGINVKVTPVPEVHILNKDTLVYYGTGIRLNATGAEYYLWSPSISLDNPVIPNPLATPLENTIYIVAGSAAENIRCKGYDSVSVRLNFRGLFFVPSAFTPDGDGKNDVFRIANLTFQKVTEFRIFNRWGMEMFSTTDGKKGWDGTRNGTPQPVGVYHYLIRIVYPDGATDTFKGNLTLIR